MYGTPGGMPVKFGGDVAYLCWAMGSPSPNGASCGASAVLPQTFALRVLRPHLCWIRLLTLDFRHLPDRMLFARGGKQDNAERNSNDAQANEEAIMRWHSYQSLMLTQDQSAPSVPS